QDQNGEVGDQRNAKQAYERPDVIDRQVPVDQIPVPEEHRGAGQAQHQRRKNRRERVQRGGQQPERGGLQHQGVGNDGQQSYAERKSVSASAHQAVVGPQREQVEGQDQAEGRPNRAQVPQRGGSGRLGAVASRGEQPEPDRTYQAGDQIDGRARLVKPPLDLE